MFSKYPLRCDDNPARVLDGEANILTIHDSQLHMLNAVGTFIWQRADGSQKLSSIIEQICDVYDVDQATAQKDALEFVELCIAKGVLTLSERPTE